MSQLFISLLKLFILFLILFFCDNFSLLFSIFFSFQNYYFFIALYLFSRLHFRKAHDKLNRERKIFSQEVISMLNVSRAASNNATLNSLTSASKKKVLLSMKYAEKLKWKSAARKKNDHMS